MLDDIFTYAGFDMDEQVYVTNVVKRRPPDNRNPTQDEIEYYLPLLLEEIRLVDPGIIVLAGAVPLAAILNLTGITKKRGTIFEVERGGRLREVMPVFHPAYLLRNPAKKAEMKVRFPCHQVSFCGSICACFFLTRFSWSHRLLFLCVSCFWALTLLTEG